MTNLSVGSFVFYLDKSRRYFPKNGEPRPTAYQKYMYQWVRLEIVSETRISWVLSNGYKIKKKEFGELIEVTEEGLQRRYWVFNNRYPLSRQLSSVSDYETLKQIAALINYSEQEK